MPLYRGLLSRLSHSHPSQQLNTSAQLLSPQEARAIAKEVFLWGMHPVAIYHLRYNHAAEREEPDLCRRRSPAWERAAKKAIASPRRRTPPPCTASASTICPKSRPLSPCGEIKDRYWSIQLVDNYARWWHLIGSQFNAPGPVRRLLIGPNWSGKLPPSFVGAEIVQSPSDMMCVVARVALTDDTPEELKVVNAIQDRMTVMSLSQWIAAGKKDVRAEDVPLTKGNYPTYPGMEERERAGQAQGRGLSALGQPHSQRSELHQADGRAQGNRGVRAVRASRPQGRSAL